jgi:hypothetical protein
MIQTMTLLTWREAEIQADKHQSVAYHPFA